MQFQVPQFIDTEDKVVGPLSLRQFGFIGAGGVLSAILYFTAQPWLWILGSIIIFGAAIALAFIKIQGRPFASVLISAFNFYWRPQTYIWKPQPQVAHPQPEKMQAEAGRSALEDILAKSAEKVSKMKSVMSRMPSRTATVFSARPPSIPEQPKPVTRETASVGSALHKSWEDLQTGAPLTKKSSDKEFLDKKMAERYQIFQRIAGDRHAAKRVDYR
jgi:hypothetical protein